MSVHDAKERVAGLDSENVLAQIEALFEAVGETTDLHAAEALRSAVDAAADFLAGDYDEAAKAQVREMVAARRRALTALADGAASREMALSRQLMAEMLAAFDRR